MLAMSRSSPQPFVGLLSRCDSAGSALSRSTPHPRLLSMSWPPRWPAELLARAGPPASARAPACGERQCDDVAARWPAVPWPWQWREHGCCPPYGCGRCLLFLPAAQFGFSDILQHVVRHPGEKRVLRSPPRNGPLHVRPRCGPHLGLGAANFSRKSAGRPVSATISVTTTSVPVSRHCTGSCRGADDVLCLWGAVVHGAQVFLILVVLARRMSVVVAGV